MGFVRTSEEIERIRGLLRPPRFVNEAVAIQFATTEEFVREVLPPCFEPTLPATGRATVGRWQSAVVGEFHTATVAVGARLGDFAGIYMLVHHVSGDMPVTIGRDAWAEPKKVGSMGLFRDGDTLYGYGERNGVRIVEVEATFDEHLGPDTSVEHILVLKHQLTEDLGLAADPVAQAIEVERDYEFRRAGRGTLVLRGSEWDPVHEIPVVEIESAIHVRGQSSFLGFRGNEPLTDRERYLPYILGRYFDDLTLFAPPSRYRESLVGG